MSRLFQGSRASRDQDRLVLAARQELLTLWSNDPWEWLTGQDLDGTPIIWTRDERDDDEPIKPFPRDKAYLKRLSRRAFEYRPMFLDKARQMMASTLVMLLADWYCRFNLARNVLVSKQKEGEAEVLIREKLRSVHARLPLWVQEESPISMTPANRVTYFKTGSTLRGVAQNFAVSEARGTTASIVIVDEAGYQEYFADIVGAVAPMASRLWALTTARATGKGAHAFKQFIKEQ